MAWIVLAELINNNETLMQPSKLYQLQSRLHDLTEEQWGEPFTDELWNEYKNELVREIEAWGSMTAYPINSLIRWKALHELAREYRIIFEPQWYFVPVGTGWE